MLNQVFLRVFYFYSLLDSTIRFKMLFTKSFQDFSEVSKLINFENEFSIM